MSNFDDNRVVSNQRKMEQDPVVLLPRRMPQSLHEAKVVNTSLRIAPGRYRVSYPPPFATGLTPTLAVTPTTSSADNSVAKSRRPIRCFAEGQTLGGKLINDNCATNFFKIADVLPPKMPRKRVYFNEEEEDSMEDMGSPKKSVTTRVIKRYKKYDDEGMPGSSVSKDDEHHMEMPPVEEPKGDHIEENIETQEYVDEVDVIEEDTGSVVGGYLPYNEASVQRIHTISIGNVGLVKQLRGENNYLKDQLDASFYRIKQLEALLVERNQRLKQLLRENVLLGVKVRKLSNELGEHASASLLDSEE